MDERGLKNKDVAELMETSDVNVSRLLSGQRGIDIEWLHAFAKALNVHVSELFLPPSRDKKVSGESDVKALLRQIEGLPEDAVNPIWRLVVGYIEDAARSEQNRLHDQSEPANPRRAPTP